MERELASHQALQKNNDLLRQERDSLTNDLQEANNRVGALQGESAPLQSRTRELALSNNTLKVGTAAAGCVVCVAGHSRNVCFALMWLLKISFYKL